MSKLQNDMYNLGQLLKRRILLDAIETFVGKLDELDGTLEYSKVEREVLRTMLSEIKVFISVSKTETFKLADELENFGNEW